MTDKNRGEFEAWCGIAGFDISRGHGGDYIEFDTDESWLAWQASRAAIEIDIPSSGDAEYWIDDVFQRVRFERDVEKAAIAAGLKVKGVSA